MERHNSKCQSPYQVAQDLFVSRYKGAEVAFVAGSHCRGEATESSDVDLVIVYPHLTQAYRESFFYNGWPVEAFVHDRETLSYFFWEVDTKSGIPALYSEDQLQNFRYGISDLLDDLKCPRNGFEANAIVAKLHEQLGDFWFRSQGKWSASGKQIPRRMQILDPSFSEKWINAFELAFSGNQVDVIRLNVANGT